MIQLGRFDELGSGVIDVHRYLPLYSNGAMPVFQESEQGVVTILPLAGEQVSDQVNEQVGSPDENSRLLPILTACMEKPQSSRALQSAAGIRNRPTFHINFLTPLLKQNLLERTLPEKPTSRLQKYRITEKGKKMLAGE